MCICMPYIYVMFNVWLLHDLLWCLCGTVKCHTKKCFFLWNNAVSCTTYVAAAGMLARLILLLCVYQSVRLFDCSSISSFDDFTAKWDWSCVCWNVCIFSSLLNVCQCIALLLVSCLSFLIALYLLMKLSIMATAFVCMCLNICHQILLILFNMSASGSLLTYNFVVVWYCRNVSAVIDVDLMCNLLHMICLPLVVSCMV